MATTEIKPFRPPPAVPAEPGTEFRLRNPWTFHLVTACAVAALTVVGGFAAAAVLDAVRLYLTVGAVGVALALVVGLSTLHSRFEANPPKSAFVPADPA
jgi:hypothetical protein